MKHKKRWSKKSMSKLYAIPIIFIAISILLATGNSPNMSQKQETRKKDNTVNTYIHVDGKDLVDKQGNIYQIKGLNFGNNAWDQPVSMPSNHNNASSYKELSELGFNSVRFYINYNLFESDNNPYQYRKEGFEWIDKNIKWAKKYNIKLILDMHIPQGGAPSFSNKLAFWTNKENTKRYVALWKKIANYYADESTILGYGLLNEPYVPECATAEDSLELYIDLIQKTKDEIRKVDKNHIIFVERAYGCINTKTGAKTYPWGDTGSLFLLDDDNTVYEYHLYEPVEFTHQGLGWSAGTRTVKYGDKKIAFPKGVNKRVVEMDSSSIKPSTKKEWQNYQSTLYQLSEDANNGFLQLYVRSIGKDASVYLDDVVIKEYNASGEFIRDLYTNNFDSVAACSYWAPNNQIGNVTYDKSVGYSGKGSIKISGTTDLGIVYENEYIYKYFTVVKGNYYQICAKVLFDRSLNTGSIQPIIQFNKAESIYQMDVKFIEYQINKFLKFSNENNVPIYMGEFGSSIPTFSNNLGGEKWVTDVFSIIQKYNLNFGYHDYHEVSFGYYTNKGTEKQKGKNKVLENIFKEYVLPMK